MALPLGHGQSFTLNPQNLHQEQTKVKKPELGNLELSNIHIQKTRGGAAFKEGLEIERLFAFS